MKPDGHSEATFAEHRVCGLRFRAFDGMQSCGRIKGHRGAHTRDPIGREREVMEAGAKATAEARLAAERLKHGD